MSFVENVAKIEAPFGVTVNNVSPGAIATPRNAGVYNDEEARRKVEACIPAGVSVRPKNVRASWRFSQARIARISRAQTLKRTAA